MEEEDTVDPQVVQEIVEDQVNEPVFEDAEDRTDNEPARNKQVPLSALQKERQKRKELELELKWERERASKAPAEEPIDDNSRYESATREDLGRTQEETLRIIEERLWIKQNPEKYERVNENLPQFLKQRPNLASAINIASNRYEEAYTLMEALTPKQRQEMKKASNPQKEAPGSPAAMPKSAVMSQTVDVMNLSDSDFNAWRASQKKRRQA